MHLDTLTGGIGIGSKKSLVPQTKFYCPPRRQSSRGHNCHAHLHLILASAAIVLNDLASSAYYAGVRLSVHRKTAPWFILATMLLSYAVIPVIRGKAAACSSRRRLSGVKEAMGRTLAKFPFPRSCLTTFLRDRSVVSRRQVSCWIG